MLYACNDPSCNRRETRTLEQGRGSWHPVWEAKPEYGRFTYAVRWACEEHGKEAPKKIPAYTNTPDEKEPETLF